jgi:hypothetical protein
VANFDSLRPKVSSARGYHFQIAFSTSSRVALHAARYAGSVTIVLIRFWPNEAWKRSSWTMDVIDRANGA